MKPEMLQTNQELRADLSAALEAVGQIKDLAEISLDKIRDLIDELTPPF